jgi:hypothetical protein
VRTAEAELVGTEPTRSSSWMHVTLAELGLGLVCPAFSELSRLRFRNALPCIAHFPMEFDEFLATAHPTRWRKPAVRALGLERSQLSVHFDRRTSSQAAEWPLSVCFGAT